MFRFRSSLATRVLPILSRQFPAYLVVCFAKHMCSSSCDEAQHSQLTSCNIDNFLCRIKHRKSRENLPRKGKLLITWPALQVSRPMLMGTESVEDIDQPRERMTLAGHRKCGLNEKLIKKIQFWNICLVVFAVALPSIKSTRYAASCVWRWWVMYTVIISKMNSETGLSETRCVLSRNDWFGELGVINQAPRNASVISRGSVGLLVFSDTVRHVSQS